MSTHAFDVIRFAKDATAFHQRRKQNQARSAMEVGISPSAFSGVLSGTMPSVEVALSVCAWMKQDINKYSKQGLPRGVKARWTGRHEDGRQVIVEHTDRAATFTERDGSSGRVINQRQAPYGNGASHYKQMITDYKEQGFNEVEHLKA